MYFQILRPPRDQCHVPNSLGGRYEPDCERQIEVDCGIFLPLFNQPEAGILVGGVTIPIIVVYKMKYCLLLPDFAKPCYYQKTVF